MLDIPRSHRRISMLNLSQPTASGPSCTDIFNIVHSSKVSPNLNGTIDLSAVPPEPCQRNDYHPVSKYRQPENFIHTITKPCLSRLKPSTNANTKQSRILHRATTKLSRCQYEKWRESLPALKRRILGFTSKRWFKGTNHEIDSFRVLEL